MKKILDNLNIIDGFKTTQYLCNGRTFISTIQNEVTQHIIQYEVRMPLTFEETSQTGTNIPDYNITSTEEDTPHLVWFYDNLKDAVKKIVALNRKEEGK